MSEHHHLSPQCIAHFDNLVDDIARSMASQAASRIRHLPAERSESTRMFPGGVDLRNTYDTARVVRPQYLRDPTSMG